MLISLRVCPRYQDLEIEFEDEDEEDLGLTLQTSALSSAQVPAAALEDSQAAVDDSRVSFLSSLEALPMDTSQPPAVDEDGIKGEHDKKILKTLESEVSPSESEVIEDVDRVHSAAEVLY